MTPAAGLDALTPSHAVRCHLVLDSGFVEAITVSRRRASRSNCVVASEGSLAHPLLSPCHTLCATVIALAPCGVAGRRVAIVHTSNQAMPCVVVERAQFFGPGMGVGSHL